MPRGLGQLAKGGCALEPAGPATLPLQMANDWEVRPTSSVASLRPPTGTHWHLGITVEPRHLEHFVVLAEEFSFTKAAARLNLVQSCGARRGAGTAPDRHDADAGPHRRGGAVRHLPPGTSRCRGHDCSTVMARAGQTAAAWRTSSSSPAGG